jgi:hypothetical protein
MEDTTEHGIMTTMTERSRAHWPGRSPMSRREALVVSGVLASLTLYLTTLLVLLA